MFKYTLEYEAYIRFACEDGERNRRGARVKKYINCAIVYAILALAGGVFFREFTKINGFDGTTTLAFIHPHYLALGMLFFVVLVMLDKLFGIQGRLGKVLVAYHVGLNVSVVMLLVRGVFQVLGTALPNGADAAISGIAGLGHIILGVSLVLVLFKAKKAVQEQ